MRARLAELGPLPAQRPVSSVGEVEAFGFPCVLKTTRGGYDGKGLWFDSAAGCEAPLAAAAEAGVGLLAEERVDFRRELSALVARAPSGRPRRTPSSSPPSATASVSRWSRRPPASRPTSPAEPRRSRCGSPGRST